MVRLVTLITQNLFFRTVLPATHAARTVLAFPSWVVLAPITVWLLDACHTFSILPLPLPCLIAGLDTEDLFDKLDFDLL